MRERDDEVPFVYEVPGRWVPRAGYRLALLRPSSPDVYELLDYKSAADKGMPQ